ncbi:PAS domain-containing protein [Rubellimicrobium sp. CFH 75288]|uniref:PAS domain-containing protein n=1 Tax=Rubellimicrobium sp. CFH 75288 TaxID=2697034 RepID=UPI001412618C|nr:PAS domain-containing protein [Rubellimicrobium sp. CFH 75288]
MSSPPRSAAAPSDRDVLTRLWRRSFGSGALPRQYGIDPATLGAILPWTLLLAPDPAGDPRIRFRGSAFDSALGYPAAGTSLMLLFDRGSRPDLVRWIRLAQSCPALIRLPVTGAKGTSPASGSAVLTLMPLRHEDSSGRLVATLLPDGNADLCAPLNLSTARPVALEPFRGPVGPPGLPRRMQAPSLRVLPDPVRPPG